MKRAMDNRKDFVSPASGCTHHLKFTMQLNTKNHMSALQLFSYCHEAYPVICDQKYVMGNFKSNITTYSMHTPYNYSLWISEQRT